MQRSVMAIIKCEICDRKFEGSENQIAFQMSMHKQGEVHMLNALRHHVV